MRLPFDDMQAAIVTLLTGQITDLSSVVVPILDDVPRGTPYPYITLGEYEAEFDHSKPSISITDANYIFNVYSDYAGTEEVNKIMAQMVDYFSFKPIEVGNNFEVLSAGFVEDASVVKGETADQEILRRGTLEYRWRVADTLD